MDGRSHGYKSFRNTLGIAVYKNSERAERGEVKLIEAAKMLDLSPMTVLRRLHTDAIPGGQYCTGGNSTIQD